MTNLLKEVIANLKGTGYTTSDVDWVGISNRKITTFSEFEKLAKNIDYDRGFGSQKINPELIIVLKDGSWFERAEYDGSEWFEFKQNPVKNTNAKPLTKKDIMF